MKSRISARLHKETQRRKNALETSSLPAKLADCRTHDVDALGAVHRRGRHGAGHGQAGPVSDYQALLPIRGKILNVQKASIADMLKNAECAAIIQVIGAGSGRTFDLDAARYGKVIIMSDADVDGAHIRTLLLTLFFRYMRPLVDAGRVYAAMPPLHRLEVISAGSAKNEYIYTYNEAEMRRTLRVDREARQEDQGAAPALQGPRRDGRRPAGRHDDGPAPPDAAAGHAGRRPSRPSGSSTCSWATTSRRARTSSSTRAAALDREPHRRLTRLA